jgi:hypothetical protein
VFPRSLFASSGTGQCNICSHIPVHSFIYTRCYISVWVLACSAIDFHSFLSCVQLF